jgi:hypothetical protein
MTDEKVLLEWTVYEGKRFLVFHFKGYLDEFSAKIAIQQWVHEFEKEPADSGKIDIIYNCNEMTGFDTAARKKWQQTMSTLKSRLANVWIISDNRFILAAAKTMGLLSGFKIRAARSFNVVA